MMVMRASLRAGRSGDALRHQPLRERHLGSFDRYLTQCIEDAVLKVKQADPYLALPEGLMAEGIAGASGA